MKKTLFNDSWRYFTGITGPFDLGAKPAEKPVTLPFDPMIFEKRDPEEKSGGAAGFYPAKTYTFVKDFELPEKGAETRYILEFEGVMSEALVYVNNEYAGGNHHGYSQFFCDITSDVKEGKTNTVKVISQHESLRSRWYSGAGIYRDVYLHTGGPVYIPPEGVKITTEAVYDAYAVIRADVEIRNTRGRDVQVKLAVAAVSEGGGGNAETSHLVTVEAMKTASARVRFAVKDPDLWSPDSPVLYTLKTSLHEGDRLLDEAEDEFGIRTLSLDPVSGLKINGVETKLRGGCIHHDNGILGAVSLYDAEVFRMKNMKAAGFNAIRSAHHPAGKALLRACDHVGILVTDELSDMWNYQKNENDFALLFNDEAEKEADRMVSKDYNHPSVILYSTGNEIPEIGRKSGRLMNRRIITRLHEKDSTRFTTNAVNGLLLAGDEMKDFAKQMGGSMENASVASIDEMNDVMSSFEEQLSAFLSENKVVERKLEEISDECDVIGFNYMTDQHTEELLRNPQHVAVGSETYPEDIPVLWDIVEKHPAVIGDFTWTGYDYLGEAGIGIFHYLDEKPQGFGIWPDRVAYCGDIDLTGYRRPVSFLREMAYGLRKEPYMFVERPEIFGKTPDKNKWKYKDAEASWTYNKTGSPVRVYVLGIGDEAALYLNGAPAGKARIGEKEPFTAVFELPFEPGELTAVCYKEGRTTGQITMKTAGFPKQFEVVSSADKIQADPQRLVFLQADLLDVNGVKNMLERKQVSVQVDGPAFLMGFGNAEPTSLENDPLETTKESFNGRVMAVVRSTGEAGEIRVTFRAEGMEEKTVCIEAE